MAHTSLHLFFPLSNSTYNSHIIKNKFACVLYAHSQLLCSLGVSNCQPWVQGPSLLKDFGGEKSYCLRFDDVTTFTQPQYDLFVKLAKLGAHYEIDAWLRPSWWYSN